MVCAVGYYGALTQPLGLQAADYEVLAALPSHPNIVPLLYHFIAPALLIRPWIPEVFLPYVRLSATTYVVLPYYPTTLERWTQAHADAGTYPEEREVLLIVLQLCHALVHLERHFVVHRDVKVNAVTTVLCASLVWE